eukprot:4270071-Prymnesium_polylepis.1
MDVCNLCSQLHFRNNDCVSHRGSVPQVRFVKWRLFTGGNPCVHLCRCVVHRSASALAVQFIPVSNCNIARADDASRSINLLSSQGVQKPILVRLASNPLFYHPTVTIVVPSLAAGGSSSFSCNAPLSLGTR